MPRNTIHNTTLTPIDRKLLDTAKRLAMATADEVQMLSASAAASLQMIATALATVLKE